LDTSVLRLRTGRELVTDLTDDVRGFVAGRGDGLLNIFVPHATAGLGILELHAGSEADLAATIDRVLPREAGYRHRHGSTGHGRDHVLPVWVSPALTLPVCEGTVPLGTWQSIVLVDTNVDSPDRKVRLSFLADSRR
jgi:secondary thiamine-phosphate synthase enzyme